MKNLKELTSGVNWEKTIIAGIVLASIGVGTVKILSSRDTVIDLECTGKLELQFSRTVKGSWVDIPNPPRIPEDDHVVYHYKIKFNDSDDKLKYGYIKKQGFASESGGILGDDIYENAKIEKNDGYAKTSLEKTFSNSGGLLHGIISDRHITANTDRSTNNSISFNRNDGKMLEQERVYSRGYDGSYSRDTSTYIASCVKYTPKF